MSHRRRLLIAASLTAALPLLVTAQDYPQDARTWFDLAARADSDRLDGVDNVVERISGGMTEMFGAALGPEQQGGCLNCRVSVVQTVNIPDGSSLIPDGSANIPDGADNIPDGADNIPDGADNIPNVHEMSVRHQLSRQEVAVMIGESPTAMMSGMAEGMEIMQDSLADNATTVLGPWAGIAGALFGGIPDTDGVKAGIDAESWKYDERQTPWLNPFRMFGAGSYMMSESAKSSAAAEQSLANTPSEAQAEFNRTRAATANANLAGIETVDGQPAMRIDIADYDEAAAQSAAESTLAMGDISGGDATFVPKSASVWIRPGKYVIVKHRIDGVASAEGQTRDFFIESNYSDFRDVPGSNLYEPYRRTMRMGGMLDDEQKAEMEEARKQLEEFDRQLASMSPQERQMVENMMGPQMDSIRSMATGGVFEYVEVIDEIIVNADLKAMFGSGRGFEPPAGNLLQRIQVDLTTLGYQPGNTDGVMDTMTTVAISQFQAEQGLAVTGEPSEQLASTLAAAVAGQGG